MPMKPFDGEYSLFAYPARQTCKALPSKERASCIKDSAAFSFDELQVACAIPSLETTGFPPDAFPH